VHHLDVVLALFVRFEQNCGLGCGCDGAGDATKAVTANAAHAANAAGEGILRVARICIWGGFVLVRILFHLLLQIFIPKEEEGAHQSWKKYNKVIFGVE